MDCRLYKWFGQGVKFRVRANFMQLCKKQHRKKSCPTNQVASSSDFWVALIKELLFSRFNHKLIAPIIFYDI